jgi:hypothetical protein
VGCDCKSNPLPLGQIQNGADKANHAFTAIRTFFRFTVRRRFISRSPAEGLQIPSRVVARERVLTDDELVKVWNAAVEIGYPFGTVVQLPILTVSVVVKLLIFDGTG